MHHDVISVQTKACLGNNRPRRPHCSASPPPHTWAVLARWGWWSPHLIVDVLCACGCIFCVHATVGTPTQIYVRWVSNIDVPVVGERINQELQAGCTTLPKFTLRPLGATLSKMRPAACGGGLYASGWQFIAGGGATSLLLCSLPFPMLN